MQYKYYELTDLELKDVFQKLADQVNDTIPLKALPEGFKWVPIISIRDPEEPKDIQTVHVDWMAKPYEQSI